LTKSEAAKLLLDNELLEEIRKRVYADVFLEFVDGTTQADEQGENPYYLAQAAARRRWAVDSVLAQMVRIAQETAER